MSEIEKPRPYKKYELILMKAQSEAIDQSYEKGFKTLMLAIIEVLNHE